MWRLYRLRKKLVTWLLSRRADPTTCSYCQCLFTVTGSRMRTLDHVVPLSKGGTWRVSNLSFACFACNKKKSDRPLKLFEASDWLRYRQDVVYREMTSV